MRWLTGHDYDKGSKPPFSRRQLQKSTKIETTDQNRFLLAVAFYLNKEFYEAIGAVRKPLDDPALHVRARYIHAICQGECGLTDEAVEHLDSVTRLEPTFGDAYVSKGALLASDGKMERASEAWAEGKQESGESARLLACEGFAQLVGGQSQDAVFTLTKAVRMDPGTDCLCCVVSLCVALTRLGSRDLQLTGWPSFSWPVPWLSPATSKRRNGRTPNS